MPQPRTATVDPPASRAPRCASPSTPRASPLSTTRPAEASSRPSSRATCAPYDEQARAPTIATAGRRSSSAPPPPRRNSPGGGSWSSRRSSRIVVSTATHEAQAALVRATRGTAPRRSFDGTARTAVHVAPRPRVSRSRPQTPRAPAPSRRSQLARRAVRERLCDVLGSDLVRGSEERGGPGHTCHPCPPSGREGQPLDGPRQQLARLVRAPRSARPAPAPALRSPARAPPLSALPDRSRAPALGPAALSRPGRSDRAALARACRDRRRAAAAEQEHSAAGSPRAPHGQRFIVATSWNRAGKTILPPTRAIEIAPSSSGCRSASSALRGNSASSSRKRTP